MEESNIAAIDLGHRFVKVAIPDAQGNPVMLPDPQGQLSYPSCVCWVDGKPVTGMPAYNSLLAAPDRGVQDWKLSIGKEGIPVGDIQGIGVVYSKDILRIHLEVVRRRFQASTGGLLSNVALTHPANFTGEAAAEYFAVAQELGINPLLIQEPIAAAFGQGLHKREDGDYLVFDLGSGTLDVAVVRKSGNIVEILVTNGVRNLGGQDFTNRLTDLALQGFESQHNFKPNQKEHPLESAEIGQRSEQAKINMEALGKASIVVSCEGRIHTVDVTQKEFENATKDLVAQCMDCVKETMDEGNLSSNQILGTVPTGGGSMMPHVRNALEKTTGRPSVYCGEPLHAVAKGGLIMMRLNMESEGKRFVVGGQSLPSLAYRYRTRTPHAIGVSVRDEEGDMHNAVILEKGQHIPSHHKKSFRLGEAGQTDAQVVILQGNDGELESECQPLGHFELENLPPVWDRHHPIEISFAVDKQGMLTAEAHDTVGGTIKELTVDYTSRLGDLNGGAKSATQSIGESAK